jgi:diguanylate cyclase (GGDEF)-like protein/PAS domain S-box-containing protein
MRGWINAFGVGIAVIIALAVPTGIFLAGYLNATGTLSFEARLSAERIAHYALESGGNWRKRPILLARFIRMPATASQPVRQTVHTRTGELVFEDGPALAAPVISRSAPIIVRGAPLGHINVAASLRNILYWTGFAGVLGSLLGLGIYYALRHFLLRRADQTLDELQEAQRSLKAQNEALRIKEAQFSNALKIARAGHWEYDVLNDLFIFNDNFFQIFKITAEDVGGYTMPSAEYARRFVHPDDLAVVGTEVQAAIETTDPEYRREFEHRMLYGDGQPGYIAVRFFIVKDEDGRTVKTYGVNQDITHRKQVELALADSQAKVQAALTNMSQGLCMFDAQQKLILSNQRFAEIYGLPPEAIKLGMAPSDLMVLGANRATNSENEDSLAHRLEQIHEGEPGSLIERLKDGRSIAVACRPTPEGGFVATFEDITERLAAEERIEHLAHYDALTDLPNRVTFYQRVGEILKRLKRSETIAVLSLDLDRFKGVNDTLGHPVGDLLLRAVADRMRSCIREEDAVARLGGDEFAIVQVSCERPSDITALARRLVKSVSAPFDLDGHRVTVGISIGIAIAPSDGDEPDVLVKNADLALYRAKADGKGVYRFFEVAMDARMRARRALELDMQNAIENGEFEVVYQPISDVHTKQITACEALLRWNHPERGVVPPMEFIPVAEETGLIVQIGEWVLHQACEEAARWPKHITLTVNLSPAQFKSRGLVRTVTDALASSGLPGSRLELEVTEGILIQDHERVLEILYKLRKLDIKIAMDDFGTGYSSLGTLRSFPFDRIKIDKSFIGDLSEKADSLAIVRAVVGLGVSLGMRTTAEGVETKEQFKILVSEGCNEVQGFLFSPPRPAADVQRLFDRHPPRGQAVA